ncbi:MAG: DNA gyrase inhibitor YacG [Gammaproteobacteria bacterium]|nr:MAG: DNA gyrase inhibitor YacG [Gammaproteobacteria bacterium]
MQHVKRRHPRCPVCSRPLPEGENPWRPFCSERCKLIDLGAWLGERHVIPGEPAGEAEDRPGKHGEEG